MYMAVSSGNHKFLDSSEKEQCYKCMGQFMCKVHEPGKVVADFRRYQKKQEDCICSKAAHQSSEISILRGIYPHLDCIISERFKQHPKE
jgi:hypothetical protein